MKLDAYHVPAVDGACRLLAYVGESAEPVSFARLPQAVGLTRTTARRITASLVAAGFLEQASPGCFRLGRSARLLGNQAQDQLGLRRIARVALAWLVQQVGETAHLGVPHAGRVELVEVADSPQPAQVASRPGALVDAYCSATGKILLSANPEFLASLRSLYRKTFPVRTNNTMTTWSALQADLARVRERGYAIDNVEYREGVRCVAVPVIDGAARTVAAIGVTAPVDRLPMKKVADMAKVVHQAAARVTAALTREQTRKETKDQDLTS